MIKYIKYILYIIIFIIIVLSTVYIKQNNKYKYNLLKNQRDLLQLQYSGCRIQEQDDFIIITKQNAEIEKLKKQNEKLENENKNLKKKLTNKTGTFKLTSYCSIGKGCNSGKCTGSGKCIKDFDINEKGWYTYKGKIVLAAATKNLLKTGKYTQRDNIHYYKYNDVISITIKGKTYEGIILDSCGACMKNKIIDLFVSNRGSVITTKVTVQ